jgi:hypothetical protein
VRVIGLDGGHVRCVARALGEFQDIIRGRDVELVEVKRRLTRGVIGQVIVALDMFKLDFPAPRTVAGIALCHEEDPALRLIGEWLGMGVVRIDPLIGDPCQTVLPRLRSPVSMSHPRAAARSTSSWI